MPFKLVGPWDRVITAFRRAKEYFVGPAEEEMQKLGEDLAKQVQMNMLADPPPELRPYTIEEKRRLGYPFPSRTWYATGWLIENAFDDLKIASNKFGSTSFIIASSTKTHPTYGIPANKLVLWTEAGTRDKKTGGWRQKPRPVIQPVIESIAAGSNFSVEEFKKRVHSEILITWADIAGAM